MEINLPFFKDVTLKIAPISGTQNAFPTKRLPKGLCIVHHGKDLVEEGIGFGVPVLMRGLETIFPGDVKLTLIDNDSQPKVIARYTLNLVERIARPGFGIVKSKLFYRVKNLLAVLIRQIPLLSDLLNDLSSLLRRIFGWETSYEEADISLEVAVIYTIDSQKGKVDVDVDMTHLPPNSISKAVVMNEQGANFFNQYSDSSGSFLKGKEIGCWVKVTAEKASFTSEANRLTFTLQQVQGARLFRGRELVDSRLAWSGFGYSVSPNTENFKYEVYIE